MQDANFDSSPAPARTRVWGLRDIATVTVVVLLLFALVPGAVYLLASLLWEQKSDGETTEPAHIALAVGNLLWYVAVIITVLSYVRSKGGTTSDLGLRWPRGGEHDSWGRSVVIAIVTLIAMYAVIYLYGLIALEILDLDFLEPSPQVEDDFYDHKIALAVLGVAVVIGAPFTEELFFRGFLYGGVRTYVSVSLAALLTGLLFSLLHFNVGLVIPFTLIGAILALSYQRSGNLITNISAHFVFNLFSFLFLVFVPEYR